MAERDFEELLRLFNKHRVHYCIVGAYALAFHVRPRYTKDLDIFVKSSVENGQKIINALAAFGFGSLKLTPEDFAEPDRCIQLGREPLRADLLTSIEGVTFDEAWRHRERGQYGKVRTSFIGRSELIRNKEHADRPQDRVDLDLLRPRRRSKRK